jgi:hypothetical protein
MSKEKRSQKSAERKRERERWIDPLIRSGKSFHRLSSIRDRGATILYVYV